MTSHDVASIMCQALGDGARAVQLAAAAAEQGGQGGGVPPAAAAADAAGDSSPFPSEPRAASEPPRLQRNRKLGRIQSACYQLPLKISPRNEVGRSGVSGQNEFCGRAWQIFPATSYIAF